MHGERLGLPGWWEVDPESPRPGVRSQELGQQSCSCTLPRPGPLARWASTLQLRGSAKSPGRAPLDRTNNSVLVWSWRGRWVPLLALAPGAGFPSGSARGVPLLATPHASTAD